MSSKIISEEISLFNSSNLNTNFKEHTLDEILKIESNYSIGQVHIQDCYTKLTNKELSDILYEVTEAYVLNKCHKLWKNNQMQNAYDFFLSYEHTFAEKIRLAKSIIEIKPDEQVGFFGDVYPLSDIDPVELALYYSHEELHKLINSTNIESQEILNKRLNNSEELKINLLEKIRSQIKVNPKIKCKLDLNLTNEILVRLFSLSELEEIQKKIEHSIEISIEKQNKTELAEKLFELAAELNITTISTPFTFDFENDSLVMLVRDYNTLELEQAIDSLSIEEGSMTRDELDRTTLTEQIFMLAVEKGIKLLREPISINFDIDDIEDLVNNYSLSLLSSALLEIQKFEATSYQTKDLINTLDTARKYLGGRPEEIIEVNWRSFAPSFIKPKIKGLDLKPAYDIVLDASKDKTLNDQSKKLIMDYRFELEGIIYGDNSTIEQQDYFEDFKDYPFEEYVRRTVEAIILPHIEVLETITKRKGKIQFVDIWAQTFSDTLKQKVRERDGFKCIVCDEETNLHVHHKVPRKYGGVNHKDNLVTLCASCHGAVETADFEHAYQKCMVNAIKSKTSLQKVVDTSKDIYLLKEEIKVELDDVFVKIERRDQMLAQQLLQTMKKIEYVFEN